MAMKTYRVSVEQEVTYCYEVEAVDPASAAAEARRIQMSDIKSERATFVTVDDRFVTVHANGVTDEHSLTEDDFCDECGAVITQGGDGWAGLCGGCADAKEA